MTQAGAKKPEAPIAIINHELQRARTQIEKGLPAKSISVDHLIRSAMTCCSKNPGLLECHPVTIIACVVQVAELGLELAGPLGQAFMIPYWNSKKGYKEATLQIGYKGFQALAYRSGQVRGITAHVVYGGDAFKFAYGTNPFIHHDPSQENTDYSDANITHVYSVMTMDHGHQEFVVMSRAQILAHQERYCKDNSDAWRKSWPGMALKTVVRQVCKFSPVSTVQAAVALDEYAEQGLAHLITGGPDIQASTQGRMQHLKNRITGVEASVDDAEFPMEPEPAATPAPTDDPLQVDTI